MGGEAIRVAVVGCGAMASILHVPVLSGRADCSVVALVDPDLPRARRLADRHGVPTALPDHRRLPEVGVDAAVVTTPNHLHAPVATDLLEAGVDVLVEKPMAVTSEGCDAMLAAAGASGAVLAVNLSLRHSSPLRAAARLLEAGVIGALTGFTVEHGFEYAWPVTSTSLLHRAEAGGGVLIDLGPHVLDLVLWVLGDALPVAYRDDAAGGVEAECEVDLVLTSGVTGRIELSRTRNLRQSLLVEGERGALEVALFADHVEVHVGDGVVSGTAALLEDGGPAAARPAELVAAVHDDFFRAVRRRSVPVVPGAEGRRSVALVEECYSHREPLVLPWVAPAAADR
jgi:predicted dehydrogenase